MERGAYYEFRDLEDRHWWFIGRKAIFSHLLRWILRERTDTSKLRALDLGCGMGAMLEELARVADVYGTDIEHEALAFCRQRGFTKVFKCSGARMPFGDRSLDLVTAFDTIEHIPEERETLAECFRVLRPGGTLFISVPAYQFLFSHQDRLVHHQRRYTAGALAKRLALAGFVVKKTSYINFLLFPAILPLVLLVKVKQALRPPRPDDYSTNVSVPISPLLNRILAGIFGFERHLLTGISAPSGHSLLAIARKPD